MNIAFKDAQLVIGDRIVSFKIEIANMVRFNHEVFIVLLDYYKAKSNRNVFAVDIKGTVLWQVEDVFDGHECPYTGITQIEPSLYLYNWCGFSCKIDPFTGNVLESTFTK